MKKLSVFFIAVLLTLPVVLSAQTGKRIPLTWPADKIFNSEKGPDQQLVPPALAVIGDSNRDFSCPVDQNQPLAGAYMAQFSQGDLAQSFIPSTTAICGAGIGIYNYYDNTGDVTIMLYDKLPNAGGNLLASGTSGFSFGDGIWLTWVDVSWPAVEITPGNTYYLVFTCTNPNPMVGGNTENPYPYGMVYANTGYLQFANYDYTFRTFGDNIPINVPVKNWAIYLAIALMGIAVTWIVIRRR